MKPSTDDALRRGDHVECIVRGVVVTTETSPTRKGRKAVIIQLSGSPTRVKFAAEDVYRKLDPVTTNILADWLEEHDCPGAAALLRQAFPVLF